MAKSQTKFPVPVLPGWESLPVAAKRLGVERQRVFQMGAEEGKLKTLHQIPGAGLRPAAYVVATAEIDALVAAQQTAFSGYAKTDCPVCNGAVGQVNASPEDFCAEHKPEQAVVTV